MFALDAWFEERGENCINAKVAKVRDERPLGLARLSLEASFAQRGENRLNTKVAKDTKVTKDGRSGSLGCAWKHPWRRERRTASTQRTQRAQRFAEEQRKD